MEQGYIYVLGSSAYSAGGYLDLGGAGHHANELLEEGLLLVSVELLPVDGLLWLGGEVSLGDEWKWLLLIRDLILWLLRALLEPMVVLWHVDLLLEHEKVSRHIVLDWSHSVLGETAGGGRVLRVEWGVLK